MAKDKSKKSSKKSSKKTTKPVVDEPVADAPVEETKVPDSSSESGDAAAPEVAAKVTYKDSASTNDLVREITEVLDTVKLAGETHRALLKKLKGVSALMQKRIRFLEKNQKKKRKGNGEGFKKPVAVKPALLKFMEKSEDELVSRVDATRFIHNYFKVNELKDGKLIKPNGTIKKLLKVDGDFDMLQLQRHMKHLFIL